MKKQHLESALQRMCVRWFRLQYPQFAKLLFAIPNGGRRSAIEAAIMQGEGVTAGVPDLFFARPAKQWGAHGMFIEMKSGTGRLTPSQKEMGMMLTNSGYLVHPCNSFDQFMKIIEKYLGPNN